MVTAYQLGEIIIYPQAKHVREVEAKPRFSEKWFVMPGRRLVHIDKLYTIAARLCLPVKEIKVSLGNN